MLTRNDRMATNNSVRVSKMHARNTKGVRLDMFFSFVAIRGTKMLRVLDMIYQRTPRNT